MTEPAVYIANETFCVEYEGRDLTIIKDQTRVAAGHPIVQANPTRFRPVETAVHLAYETADAPPVAKRTSRKAPTD